MTIEKLTKKTGFPLATLESYFPGLENNPIGAIDLLNHVDSLLERSISESMLVVDQMLKQHLSNDIMNTMMYLIKYRNSADLYLFRQDTKNIVFNGIEFSLPLECHNTLIDRLRSNLFKKCVANRVVFMDRDNYLKWLESQNLADNEANRAAWAAHVDRG